MTDIIVNGVKPLGYEQTETGKMIYVVESTEFKIEHRLKPTQLINSRLGLIAPVENWRAAFPSDSGHPAWKKAAAWLAHECMKMGPMADPEELIIEEEAEGPPKQILFAFGVYQKIRVGDWFIIDKHYADFPGAEKNIYNCAKHQATEVEPKRSGFVFECTWDEETRTGRIERIR